MECEGESVEKSIRQLRVREYVVDRSEGGTFKKIH